MAGRMLMGILSAKKVIDKENGSGLQHLLVVSLDWQAVLDMLEQVDEISWRIMEMGFRSFFLVF